MNKKSKVLFKNLHYTISANFVILSTSVLINLLVPKFIGINEYSFWQLYVFYASYVGFFHFGWLDGIYLKIGGADYKDLKKRILGSQFWYLLIFQLFLAICLIIFTMIFVRNPNKNHILLLTSVILIVTNAKTFILYILQSTSRIKEYARLSRDDRYFYIVAVLIYLFLGGRNFLVLIFFDIFSNIIVTCWGFSRIKDMLWLPPIKFKKIFHEIIDNIKIGSNLMISNVASMLTIGFSRLLVEHQWNIRTFGKLSLTLSISNMFMVFINAVGVVMFPLLRRTRSEGLPRLYMDIRNLFVPFTFALLLLYNPIRAILIVWLPEYKESLVFMGILFPMVVFEGRMALLVTTYLKTIRKEKIILFTNITTLILSALGAFIATFIVRNIFAVVIVIMISLAFRCILAEELLAKEMFLNLNKNIILESLLTVSFIIGNLIFSSIFSFILYFLCFLLYLAFNFSDIKKSGVRLLMMVRN